jgi:hypothetical protein
MPTSYAGGYIAKDSANCVHIQGQSDWSDDMARLPSQSGRIVVAHNHGSTREDTDA